MENPKSPDDNPRVALITGAARGIGAAVARRLASDGWSLVLTDLVGHEKVLTYALPTLADLEAVAADCGPDTMVYVADVREQGQMDAATALAVGRFGGLDAAIGAAGVIWGGEPLWRTPDAAWRTMIDVNLGGIWKLAHAAIPALLQRPQPRSGRFVALASAASVRGMPQLAAYSASKAGVAGLVRSLAAELGPDNITANAVGRAPPGPPCWRRPRACTACDELKTSVVNNRSAGCWSPRRWPTRSPGCARPAPQGSQGRSYRWTAA